MFTYIDIALFLLFTHIDIALFQLFTYIDITCAAVEELALDAVDAHKDVSDAGSEHLGRNSDGNADEVNSFQDFCCNRLFSVCLAGRELG